MKIRLDYITNSSSSSFLITKKNIKLDFLINTVMKDFYIELCKQWNEDDVDLEAEYNEIDILNNENAIFTVNETPQHQWDDDYHNHYSYWGVDEPVKEPEVEEYEIYNNCCSRFPWAIVEKIMNKYKITEWRPGYCD